MRATGIEGAGNNVGGCYPDADMLIIFPPIVPTPVLWGEVDGERTTTGVNVNWTTMQETNVDYFIVQRATDGVNYHAIGQVAAAGNTRAATQYAFQDLNPGAGANVYRVMSVDRSGESDISRSFEVNYFTPSELTWGPVGPNPTTATIDLSFYSPQAAAVSMQVFDATGRRVMAAGLSAIEGGNTKQIDLSGLNPGSYFVHLQVGDQKLARRVMKL
jgi:Secretion system C-terminal sorting domain